MKSRISKIAVLCVLFIATGCASGPSYKEHASQIKAPLDNHGRIYFFRPSVVGAAVQPAVRVNGEVVSRAVPKGFMYVDRPAGSYEVSASTEAKRSLTFNLAAGESKYVCLQIQPGILVGHIKPVLVDRSVGEKEISKTNYIGE